MRRYGDLPAGSVPRHRDPSRFGFHDTSGEWVSYEGVTEGRLLFSCGHTARVAVGHAPGKSEEEVRAFVARASEAVCSMCGSQKGRLRYTSQGERKDAEAKRERD